jgi:hypothetical protein
MIGGNEPFDVVLFFWSEHCDTQVLYVGHAETWDTLQINGSVEARLPRCIPEHRPNTRGGDYGP